MLYSSQFFLHKSSGSFIRILLISISLFWLLSIEPVSAQADYFWEYEAKGEILDYLIEDLNEDGVKEILLVSDQNRLTLLGADGLVFWENSFGEDQILGLIVLYDVQPDSDLPTNKTIVLSTSSQLIFANLSGELISTTALPSTPLELKKIDLRDDGREDLLVGTRKGELILIDGLRGTPIWTFKGVGKERPNERNADPIIEIFNDLDGDGFEDIGFTYAAEEGFGELVTLTMTGALIWRQPLSGNISTLSAFAGDQIPLYERLVVVGTDRGTLWAYRGNDGADAWFRTLNRPITAAQLIEPEGADPNNSILLVGTEVGMLVGYDHSGRRLLDTTLSTDPDLEVLHIDSEFIPVEPSDLPSAAGEVRGELRWDALIHLDQRLPIFGQDRAEAVLIDNFGELRRTFEDVSQTPSPVLEDFNGDGTVEVLIPTFSSLVMEDAGDLQVSQLFGADWTYRLNARPNLLLSVPGPSLDQSQLWVASGDGRISILSRQNGQFIREIIVEGIPEQAILVEGRSPSDQLVLVRINQDPGEVNDEESELGAIELFDQNGDRVWENRLSTRSIVTKMLAESSRFDTFEQIYFSTSAGVVGAANFSGELLWEHQVNGNIVDLLILDDLESDDNQFEIIAITGSGRVEGLNRAGQLIFEREGSESSPLRSVSALPIEGRESQGNARFLVENSENQITPVDDSWEPIDQTPLSFESIAGDHVISNRRLFVGEQSGRISAYSLESDRFFEPLWETEVDAAVRSMTIVDITGQGRFGLLVSDNAGQSRLLSIASGIQIRDFALTSPILDAVTSPLFEEGDREFMIALTENGVLRALSVKDNRAPLLVNPVTVAEPNQYTINVDVIDPDRDLVTVVLYVWDNNLSRWISMGEKQARNGRDLLFWVMAPPQDQGPVRYRFEYDDATHRGFFEPEPGASPIEIFDVQDSLLLLSLVIIGVFMLSIFLWRFSNTRFFAARLFMREIRRNPEEMLYTVADIYLRTAASPDILLSLAEQGRNLNWKILADLCDGLYLIADRPLAGFEILSQALERDENDQSDDIDLRGRDAWQNFFQTGRLLYSVPSVLELALQKSKFDRSIRLLEAYGIGAESFTNLEDPLERLLAGSRVDRAKDRLSYLYEADILLERANRMQDWQIKSIPNQIAVILIQRWRGLINASISELQGRPWLIPTLKTRRLVGSGDTQVVLSLLNDGQAAAEQVSIELAESPDFGMINASQRVALLSVGRTISAQFSIQPHERKDLRLTFSISYVDSNAKFHHFEFADRATFLNSTDEFRPIPNPYAPGTPLRNGSPLFYGREDLTQFILNNAKQVHQQNVVVLVGQRRTGKTSILLNLNEIEHENLLPVYIDCQSLGVVPGMGAFLNDLAWFISDACLLRDVDIPVPDSDRWDADPVHFFQRTFLPSVFEHFPETTNLLLVFDEFEAFEDLVSSGNLPSQFFSFLRHMMQHAHRLSFVFAGTHLLEEMGSDYWSVLFNIALYRKVSYLDRNSLRRLISEPVDPYLIYDDLALEKIQRVTAGHPYFVQLVCYTLVNYANHHKIKYITITDVNVSLKEMLRLGEVHFAYLWQESSFAERAVLTAMAHLVESEEPISPSELSDSLEAYDFQLEPHEIVDALRGLVAREIMQEFQDPRTSLYEMKIGLVSMWVAENKSLSKLYEA